MLLLGFALCFWVLICSVDITFRFTDEFFLLEVVAGGAATQGRGIELESAVSLPRSGAGAILSSPKDGLGGSGGGAGSDAPVGAPVEVLVGKHSEIVVNAENNVPAVDGNVWSSVVKQSMTSKGMTLRFFTLAIQNGKKCVVLKSDEIAKALSNGLIRLFFISLVVKLL